MARGTPAALGEDVTVARASEVDGQWVMPAKNYASTRYSPLPDCTTEGGMLYMFALPS